MSYSLDHPPMTSSLDIRAADKPAGWANYNVAAEVASKRNRIRHAEALRLDVMIGITGVDE